MHACNVVLRMNFYVLLLALDLRSNIACNLFFRMNFYVVLLLALDLRPDNYSCARTVRKTSSYLLAL